MSTYDSIIAKGISQGISQRELKVKITGIIKSLKIGKLSIEDTADTF